MRLRLSTVLAVVVLGGALVAAVYVVGHAVLHESNSLTRASSSDTSPVLTTTTRQATRSGSHGWSRSHLKRVVAVAAICGLILLTLLYAVGAIVRSTRRQRWRA